MFRARAMRKIIERIRELLIDTSNYKLSATEESLCRRIIHLDNKGLIDDEFIEKVDNHLDEIAQEIVVYFKE